MTEKMLVGKIREYQKMFYKYTKGNNENREHKNMCNRWKQWSICRNVNSSKLIHCINLYRREDWYWHYIKKDKCEGKQNHGDRECIREPNNFKTKRITGSNWNILGHQRVKQHLMLYFPIFFHYRRSAGRLKADVVLLFKKGGRVWPKAN